MEGTIKEQPTYSSGESIDSYSSESDQERSFFIQQAKNTLEKILDSKVQAKIQAD